MKRIAQFVAAATIAVMLGTTAATFLCAAECDRPRPVAARTDHCHGDVAAPTKVGAADDCTEHAIQASGSIARTEPLKIFLADWSSTTLWQPVVITSAVSSIFAVRRPAIPPSPQNLPLRI